MTKKFFRFFFLLVMFAALLALCPAAFAKEGTFNGLSADVDSSGNLLINAANFPDPVFLCEVQKLPGAGDGAFSAKEAAAVTSLNLDVYKENLLASGVPTNEAYECRIRDLTGIGYFTALESLNCSNNSLAFLDLSNNKALKTLQAENQQVFLLSFYSGSDVRFTLSQFEKLDLNKVSDVTGTSQYDAATGDAVAAPNKAVSYLYDTGFAGHALPVALQISISNGFSTKAIYQDGEATDISANMEYNLLWYHYGDAPYEICFEERYFRLSTVYMDFLRGLIEEYRPLDEHMMDNVISNSRIEIDFRFAVQVDPRFEVDEENIPTFSKLYIEGENEIPLDQLPYVIEVESMRWDAERRLLYCDASASFDADSIFSVTNEEGNLFIDEMIKSTFADVRIALPLTMPASAYENGEFLDESIAVEAEMRVILPTNGVTRVHVLHDMSSLDRQKVLKMSSVSCTPSSTLTLTGDQDPVADTFLFSMTTSYQKAEFENKQISITGAGEIDLGDICLTGTPRYTGGQNNLTVTLRQIPGNDPAYTYDDSVWTIALTFEADQKGDYKSVSITGYSKENGAAQTSAAFTNVYTAPAITLGAQNGNLFYTEDTSASARFALSALRFGQPAFDPVIEWKQADGTFAANAPEGLTASFENQQSVLVTALKADVGTYVMRVVSKKEGVNTGYFESNEVTVQVQKSVYRGPSALEIPLGQNTVYQNESYLLPEPPKGASYPLTGVLKNSQGLLSDYSVNGQSLLFSAYNETAGVTADLALTVSDATNYKPYDLTIRFLTVPVTAALKGGVKGYLGEKISPNQKVTVTLSGATFKTPFSDAQAWVTNLPQGLTATVLPGKTSKEAVIEFSGLPLTTFNEPVAITIPHDALKNARNDMTVTKDENVLFFIEVKPPQTGDQFPHALYLLLLLLGVAGIAIVKAKRKS